MALYRKYRPASFAEVVGQDQVTRPLSVALDTGHINHAYLFSGPRGCGKTSSARILARSLNCAEGPTSTPCGKCPSCVSLAPGGSGNLDVTELDAASHNGVEDMRALRDRAYYAPAESRYRVFIIDEAHMISSAGANALLKIVEEPPEHTIFIFATTEPEKVIGTIRSRVHHYPFRLLTPQSMRQLLHHIVEEEQVQVEESVYSLVINAGGGSPRDSLSILDQLLAGAGPEGLTYEMALPLLGVTDLTLIDDSVSALAANDSAAAFQLIDRVIEAGHDPRRYVQDLVDRLRDLMILQVVPDAFEQGLVDAPPARQEVMREEAGLFPPGRLAELADRVNERITDLRGATAPRLLLEILMAHLIVVPSAVGAAAPAKPPRPAQSAVASPAPAPAPAPAPETSDESVRRTTPAPESTTLASSEGQDLLAQVQREWGSIRNRVGEHSTVISVMVAQAEVVALEGDTLVISHTTGALARRLNEESKAKVVRAAIAEAIGQELNLRFVVGEYVPPGHRPVQAPDMAGGASSRGTGGEQPARHRWEQLADEGRRQLAERAEGAEFSNGVPLPPEPDSDFGEGLERPQEVSAHNPDSASSTAGSQAEDPHDEENLELKAEHDAEWQAARAMPEVTQTAPGVTQKGQGEPPAQQSPEDPSNSLESAMSLLQKELGAKPV